ncbi:MAG: hypothetical protein Q8M03_07965 [Legionella sp.]|nr:hypothetical protein [Legionella sp.]
MDVIINGDTDCVPLESKSLVTQHDWGLNFLASLGYDATNPPIGDFLRQYYQLTGKWIVAAPIYWEATHNDAMIVAEGASLPLTDDESRRLFAEVASFLGEEGIKLHYHNAHTWLVNVDNKSELVSPPTHLMLHRSMMPVLDKMDKSLYWQRIMTELQMFLSAHPVNNQRQDKLPVNGLWFYGSGVFTIDSNKKIITDNEPLINHFPDEFSSNSREGALNRVSDDVILLITQQTSANFDHLRANLCNYKVRWFWNNKAYLTPKSHWWRRLWRGFINAYQTKRTT